MAKSLKNAFKEISTNKKLMKSRLPLKLANTIQNHFLKGFDRGGGSTDASVGGWKQRKRSRNARVRKRSIGRAILVNKGHLRSDIKKRKLSFSNVTVGTRSVPYAGYLNEGTSKMVKREFIGDSRILERKIEQRIKREMDKIFK